MSAAPKRGGQKPRRTGGAFSGRGAGALRSLAALERPDRAWPTARRLARYFLPFRRDIALAVVWVIAWAAADAAAPALTGRLVDAAVGAHGDLRVVVWPGVALALTYVADWWAERSQILALFTVGQRALVGVRAQIFDKVLQLSVAFFDRAESGDLMSRLVNDVDTLNGFFANTFRRIFSAVVSVVMTLAFMLVWDWRLALGTVSVVPLLLLLTWLFSAMARRAYRQTRESIGDVSASLAEELGGVRVAQAFARTGLNLEEFQARNAANRDANIRAAVVSSAFTPSLALVSALATAVAAGLGGWMAMRGSISIGIVVAFIAYARLFFGGVSRISSVYADTQSAMAGAERVFELLDRHVDVSDAPDAEVLGRAEGRVDFEGVSFAYGDGPEVLHALDLHVEPGQTVAIVGATGAGKSTIASLVTRFYDPTAGRVRLDGRDLRDVTVASLRANVGLVLQEPFLFAGTVADNIRYGRLDASDKDVRSAAETARAMAFVSRLPAGLDTVVGERGTLLSTGQRQLIAFARTLLADPAVLIMDEATSSVDTRTELLIQDAMRELLRSRTALVIAHRLSTVRDADRIIVLDDGRIIEDGTYDALLAAGGAFAALHSAQFPD